MQSELLKEKHLSVQPWRTASNSSKCTKIITVHWICLSFAICQWQATTGIPMARVKRRYNFQMNSLYWTSWKLFRGETGWRLIPARLQRILNKDFGTLFWRVILVSGSGYHLSRSRNNGILWQSEEMSLHGDLYYYAGPIEGIISLLSQVLGEEGYHFEESWICLRGLFRNASKYFWIICSMS